MLFCRQRGFARPRRSRPDDLFAGAPRQLRWVWQTGFAERHWADGRDHRLIANFPCDLRSGRPGFFEPRARHPSFQRCTTRNGHKVVAGQLLIAPLEAIYPLTQLGAAAFGIIQRDAPGNCRPETSFQEAGRSVRVALEPSDVAPGRAEFRRKTRRGRGTIAERFTASPWPLGAASFRRIGAA